jgi:hypothetical protein
LLQKSANLKSPISLSASVLYFYTFVLTLLKRLYKYESLVSDDEIVLAHRTQSVKPLKICANNLLNQFVGSQTNDTIIIEAVKKLNRLQIVVKGQLRGHPLKIPLSVDAILFINEGNV